MNEGVDDFGKVFVGGDTGVAALSEVLADEAVGVLVGPALPSGNGVVRERYSGSPAVSSRCMATIAFFRDGKSFSTMRQIRSSTTWS